MAIIFALVLLLTANAFAQTPVDGADLTIECLTPFFPLPFNPQAGIPLPEPLPEDSREAAKLVKNDGNFSIPQTYGEMGRPGVTRGVPVDWAHGSCLIHIEAKDLAYQFEFKLEDLYPAIEGIITTCIDKRQDGTRQGGFAQFPLDKRFYVMVQANPGPQYLSLNYAGLTNEARGVVPRIGLTEQGLLSSGQLSLGQPCVRSVLQNPCLGCHIEY